MTTTLVILLFVAVGIAALATLVLEYRRAWWIFRNGKDKE